MIPPDQLSAPLVVASLLYFGLVTAGVWVNIQLRRGRWALPAGWADGVGQVAGRPWTYRHGLLGLGFMLLMYTLAGGLALGAGSGMSPGGLVIISSVLSHMMPLCFLWLLMKRGGMTPASAFGIQRGHGGRDLGLGGLYFLAALPYIAVFSLVYQWLMNVLGRVPEPQALLQVVAELQSPWVIGYFVLLILVVAPVVEEVWFRGVWLPLLVRRIGAVPSVALLSFGFAVLHGSADAAGPLMLIGAAFAIAYLYTGSLRVSIFLHALFNGVNLAMIFLLKDVM